MRTESPSTTRRASLADIDRLIELRKWLLSGGSGHYAAKSQEEELAWQSSYRQWLIRNIENNPKVFVAAAEPDTSNEIVACAIGIIDERAPMRGLLNGKSGWIQTVVVDPQWQRRGIAEQVMNEVLNWFKQQDVGKVVLQTTEIAKPLYRKLGFGDTGEALLYINLLKE